MVRWRVAQILGLLATAVLLVLLVRWPSTGLKVLWDIAIPILPAVFLVQPGLWRNVCPIATLSMLPNRATGGRMLGNGDIAKAGTLGIVLLAVLVPARRFLFNTDGPVLAGTVAAVVGLAVILGAVYDRKAGFCSSICPVLPVERLYGQRPLLMVPNARCLPCTMCVSRGCLDITQTKSIPQILGRDRMSHGWLGTYFGVFAAAFPGFVIGYNLTTNGAFSTAGPVYFAITVASALSYGITFALVRGLNLGTAVAIRTLGAVAFAAYYWFAAATITNDLGLPPYTTGLIRGAAFTLLLVWISRDVAAFMRREMGHR